MPDEKNATALFDEAAKPKEESKVSATDLFDESAGLKKKESTAPSAAGNTESPSDIWSRQASTGSQTSLKDISPNLSTTSGWFNGVHNVPDDKSAFDEAKTDAETQKKVALYNSQFQDALSMGQTPLAKPDQMLTGKEKQKLQEKDAYTYMRHDFLGNPKYLSLLEREQYYNHIKTLLPKADFEKIKQQGEYYAYQQSAYNVARVEMGKNPTPDNMYTVGDYQAQNGDLNTSLKTFSKILQDHPDSPKGYKGLAYLAYAHHDVKKAIDFIDKGLQATGISSDANSVGLSKNVELLTDKANYLWLSGNHTDAIDAINNAISNAKPGSKEMASVYQLRAVMRNANGNIPGATEDREKGLQAYDSYNAKFGYYYQGGEGTPKEEKKTVKVQTKDKEGNVVYEPKEETVELSQEQQTKEKETKHIEEMILSDNPDKAAIGMQLMKMQNFQEQVIKERQDWLSKTHGIGLNAYISNPGQYINEHIENSVNQTIEGVQNLGQGIGSIYDELVNGKSNDITPTKYSDLKKQSWNKVIKGALQVASGIGAFTPEGMGISAGFEQSIQDKDEDGIKGKVARGIYSVLTPGTNLYELGQISKETAENIDSGAQLAAMIGLHKIYNYGFAKPIETTTPFEPFSTPVRPEILIPQEPSLNPENPLSTKPLEDLTATEAKNEEIKSTALFKILAGQELSTSDVTELQSAMGGTEEIKKFASALPELIKNNPKKVEDLTNQLSDFTDKQTPKKTVEVQSEKSNEVKYIPNPTKAVPDPIEEVYAKKDNKWVNSEGKEIISKPLINKLNELEVKPEKVKLPNQESQLVVTPTSENPNVKFKLEVKKPEIDYTAGKMAEPFEGMKEAELNKHIANTSENPAEILHAYEEEREKVQTLEQNDVKSQAVNDAIGKRGISRISYKRHGDTNNITEAIAKQYFRSEGQNIDEAAQEASYVFNPNGDGTDISVQDVVNLMEKGYVAKRSPLMKNLENRYQQVTGQPLSEKQIALKDKQLSQISKNYGQELSNEDFWKQSPEKIANSIRPQEENITSDKNIGEAQKVIGEPTEANTLNALENEYNGTDENPTELVSDKYPMDWADTRTQNISRLEPSKLTDIHNILKGNGYGLIQQLSGENGVRFLDNLVKNGMLKDYEAAIFKQGNTLNKVGTDKMAELVKYLTAEGLNGESKEPYIGMLDSLDPKIQDAITGNAFHMLSMGVNSPLDVIQKAVIALSEEKKGISMEDLDEHTQAMQYALSNLGDPADLTKLLNNYKQYLEGDPHNGVATQSKTEALNNALSTDMDISGVDEALKPIKHEKETDTKGIDETHNAGEQGEETQEPTGEAPDPANIQDYTDPIIEEREVADIVMNTGFGATQFKALLNLRNDFNRPWLNQARYVIEGASRARSAGISVEESQLNKLQEKMLKNFPISRNEELELNKFIDEQHQQDVIKQKTAGNTAVSHKPYTGQNLHAPAPESWTPNQKEHYRVIDDLQDKMTQMAENAMKVTGKDKKSTLTPEWVQRIKDTPNYLPRTPKKQSKIYKELDQMKAAARKALQVKDMDWNDRQKEKSKELLKKIGEWGVNEAKSLVKNNMTTKDLKSMLTTQRYHKAISPDGTSFVVKFTHNGIIEKWDNKKSTEIGTYKGKVGGEKGISAPKNAIWVAKTPEKGKPDHYIFDNKPVQVGVKDVTPVYIGKRNLIKKAFKQKDYSSRTLLLDKAGLPADFFDKFESKKNPNSTINNIVNKSGSFTGADGKEYHVLPETTENIENNTNEEYEKNPLWGAIRAYNNMNNLYVNTKYFHDIMNSPSMKDLVFTPSKEQLDVVKNNELDNVKKSLDIKDMTVNELRAYDANKKANYEKAGIPDKFDEDWTTPRKEDGINSVMPDIYLDTYFKKNDYKMLKGDMVRKPQDPQRAVNSIVSLWFMTKMNPLTHVWNVGANVFSEGTDPTLMGRAKNSFLNQDEFYKQYKRAGGFTVGDVNKGMVDTQKGFTDELAKEDPELKALQEELKKTGLSARLEKAGEVTGKILKKGRNIENAIVWHTQNIGLFSEAMTRMEGFGYKMPPDLNKIDWSKPEPNIALQKSIEDMQRTVNTYYMGDKAYGMNNVIGQLMARASRTKLLTLFAPYRHGNLRVLRNRTNDLKNIIPAAIREGGNRERSGDKESARRAFGSFMWTDKILAGLGLTYMLNQWANGKDKDKTEEWYYPGIYGMIHKGINAAESTFGSESTHTDASNARGVFLDEVVSLSAPTIELYDIYANRNSFSGKPIFEKDASAIDNGQKLFTYLLAGGNIYTAVNYMTEGNQIGMDRGLATLLVPVKFKQFTPSEKLYVNNIWEWKNTYRNELKKANDILEHDSTSDATVVRLSKQYVDKLKESDGKTSEFMLKEIPKIQYELMNKFMSKGIKSPLSGYLQKSDSTERDEGTTDDSAAIKYWENKLEVTKQCKIESDSVFNELYKEIGTTGQDDTLNIRGNIQDEIQRQLSTQDSLMHDIYQR